MNFLRNRFVFPSFFFSVALFLDTMVTAAGTDYFSAIEKEGNPVVQWLWGMFGDARLLLPILWALLTVGASYLLFRSVKPFLGLWLLYGVGTGHLLGFLSWTPLQIFVYSGSGSNVFSNLAIQVIISAILGFLFAKIQLH